VVRFTFFVARNSSAWPVKLTLTRPQMFDSAGQRAAAKDGELDCHYETEFH
jgi:hypothetical protein